VSRASGARAEPIQCHHSRAFADSAWTLAAGDGARCHPPDVLGWRSIDFATFAAGVYGGLGIRTYLPNTGGTVGAHSFGIRHYKAAAGVYISASHNPPDHNGVKLYDGHGCQVIPPDDAAIAALVSDEEVIRSTQHILPLDDVVHEEWMKDLLEVVGADCASGLTVAYTALHGAGAQAVPEILSRAGATVHVVSHQQIPDGTFSSIPGASPNPENAGALADAIALGQAMNADLVLGTDPDADRLGVAVPTEDGWRVLNGNEIAALCVAEAVKTAPIEALVLRTAVTTSLVSRIAHRVGLRVVDQERVGFKYLGAALDREGGPLAIAVEESHGVLVSGSMRDKDAVGAALLMARAARSAPLDQQLNRLDDTFGPVRSLLVMHPLSGPDGRARLITGLAQLRAKPPLALAGRPIVRVEDWLAGPVPTSDTEVASRDVLRFWLADGVVTLRASGTEAKVKVYVERGLEPGESTAGLAESLQPIADALVALL
jgi:phosphomannomutase